MTCDNKLVERVVIAVTVNLSMCNPTLSGLIYRFHLSENYLIIQLEMLLFVQYITYHSNIITPCKRCLPKQPNKSKVTKKMKCMLFKRLLTLESKQYPLSCHLISEDETNSSLIQAVSGHIGG
ncbi:hypothetical protein LOAG_07079 [Loa loa]|uniref:Uncharacterized protein n=1 Tax=Loa loa TaxID=7209 RepID=A0A1S0TWP6_LOALO|nr:hypothetical protein LOAG_07079 [Loa loa]EFO21406.1 hypothetical protein LOAG_07079 [Loa loa]